MNVTILRMAYWMLLPTVLLIGIYLGRFSVTHKWAELGAMAVWGLSAYWWTYRLWRESRREQEEIRSYIRHLHSKEGSNQ